MIQWRKWLQRRPLKPYETLQRHWRDTGAGMSTVALSAQSIDSLEQKYGLRLPDDFRDYLLHACPANENWDNDLIGWWSIDRIKNIVDEHPHKIKDETIERDAAKYLFFADYCIWCWAWAIACGEDQNRGRVVVISGHDRFVADSFAQFVDLYIDDCHQLV
jgi:hypothetical protein